MSKKLIPKRVFRARTNWIGGEKSFKSQIQIRDFPSINIDEPVELRGTNEGPTPLEMFLGAIGGCLVMCYAFCAERNNIDLEDLYVDVSATVGRHKSERYNLYLLRIDKVMQLFMLKQRLIQTEKKQKNVL